MNSIYLSLLLSLACVVCPAMAASQGSPPARAAETSQDARLKRAIARIVAAYNFPVFWPMTIDNILKQEMGKFEDAARKEVDAIDGLSPARRAQGHARMVELTSLMGADMREMYTDIDPVLFNTLTMAEVYPKYLTLAEVETLADYYSGATYQNWWRLQLEMKTEAALLEQSEEELWPNFAKQLSKRDVAVMKAFADSAIGHKEQAVMPEIGKDMAVHFRKGTSARRDALALKHGPKLRKVLLELKQPAGSGQ